jgi:gliding motility-associated lipoprotein GldB
MKKTLLLCALIIAFVSCDKKTKVEKEVENIPVKVKVVRFDKLFFETSPKDLGKLKKEFPYFFPQGTPDHVWLEKFQNPLWRELYSEVQKKYSNFDTINGDLNKLFQHIKFYFPETKTPKVVTVISEMDYNHKVIYTDSLAIISLELYLGKNHKFYQFPQYLKQNFEPEQMLPDMVSSFSLKKIAPISDKTLLTQMVYFGKQLYLKDLLLPDYSDANRIGYTPDQILWCQENESYMWRFFLENELLYNDDNKLDNRFINPAPFSKFYLEIDNESPGSIGKWIGWQMVRAYMKNNEVSLQEMLQMNTKELFEKSKYKPKKNDQ